MLLVFHVIWQKIQRDAIIVYGRPSRSNGLMPSTNRWLSCSNSLMFLMSGWRSSLNGLMFLANGWPSHLNCWQTACKRKAVRHVFAWEVTILNFLNWFVQDQYCTNIMSQLLISYFKIGSSIARIYIKQYTCRHTCTQLHMHTTVLFFFFMKIQGKHKS